MSEWGNPQGYSGYGGNSYSANPSNQSSSTAQGSTQEQTFFPLPVTISKKERADWQWLQDTMGYTFAYNQATKEYFYVDSASGITYDYTPYYTSLGYKDGKPPRRLLAAANASNSAIGNTVFGADPSKGSTSASGKQQGSGSSKRKYVRSAGGEIWADSKLEEFNPNDFRMFVGDLGKEVSDDMLRKAFSAYPSVEKVRVVRDSKTGFAKGYGFVSFLDPKEYVQAFKEMNGKYIGNRPVKLHKSMWKERNMKLGKVVNDQELSKVYKKVKKHLN
ncbi:hypothetical protein BB560_001817 [Smittium megazygosporum]|uniref:RRM domain-containing protein n=1 Tax=Smittium megazygosporum TaxID=133381 RepID=A0A2T9ZGG8_9FUNG|nr:hypothetical protein BB560_001817 [Smittium megazygosporum]